ncbi:MAG: hypothetical protein ABI295_12225 [Xanthomarina sp.]
MEQDISNLKTLWGEKKSSPIDLDQLIKNLTDIEKKNKKERIFLLFAFPLTMLVLSILLPIFKNTYYLLSVIFIGIGMFLILIQLYKMKLPKSRKEESFTNQEFIKATIKSLKVKLITTTKYMWIYTFLLLLGLNTGYVEVLHTLDISVRILIHLLLTLTILIFMYLGIKKRALKNEKDILTLINKLEDLIS